MNKKLKLLSKISLLFLIIILNVIAVDGQETFKRTENIPEGKCVVYVFREPSLNGAAAVFKVRVWALYEDYFNYNEKESIYIPYAKLENKEYVPVIVDADKYYRVTVSNVGVMYFKGKAGSESIIRIDGGSAKFCCIKGSSYWTKKTMLISKKFEQKLFSEPDKIDKFSEDSKNKLLEKIKKMTLAQIISKNIETRK